MTSSGKLHAPLVSATGHAVYIEVGHCLMQYSRGDINPHCVWVEQSHTKVILTCLFQKQSVSSAYWPGRRTEESDLSNCCGFVELTSRWICISTALNMQQCHTSDLVRMWVVFFSPSGTRCWGGVGWGEGVAEKCGSATFPWWNL